MTGCGLGVPDVITFSASSVGRYPSAKAFSRWSALGQNPELGRYQEIARFAGLSEKSVSCLSTQDSAANASS